MVSAKKPVTANVRSSVQKNPHVGIIEFEGKGMPAADIAGLTDLVRIHLVNAKYFVVLDRNNMDKILKEQEFQQTGCTEASCAVQIGKLLSMQYMVVGKLSRIQNMFVLTVSLLNVETSAVYISQKAEFVSMVNAESAVSDLVDKIVFSFKGREGMTMSNPWVPVLYSAAGVSLAAAVSFNAWGGISANDANGYYNDTYKTITNETASNAWVQYSGMVTASQVRYIVGYSLYAVSAGLFIWAFFSPAEVVRDVPLAIVPTIGPDTTGITVSYRF
ncbi:MAG: hypothetical protein HZC28_07175 [Spirochaetes bacterium]|nr:hypothetical protein [Spirochaetota bacterium]